MKVAIQIVLAALLIPLIAIGFVMALIYGSLVAGWVYAGEFLDWIRA
jgi:hypothetical protein